MKQVDVEKNRLRYVDITKGIAIISIILGHLGNDHINRVVYTFHVPVFFFITGFFTNTKRSIRDFVKNKVRTLLVPYVVTCLIITVIGTVEGWILGDARGAFFKWCYASVYGAGDTYTEPFYIPAIGALWFLWATFWGSLFLRISLECSKYLRIAFIFALFLFGYCSRAICWFPLSLQAGACAAAFLYMGYLLKDAKESMKQVSSELKCAAVVFSVITWYFFIKDFQSFWFVHCDFGRGIVDILGSVCACFVVLCISKMIDWKTNYISRFLSFFGKYSLLVLCVHIIELNLFPWRQFTDKLIAFGMPEAFQLPFLIIAKLAADLTCVYILSRISFVRKLYGYRNV